MADVVHQYYSATASTREDLIDIVTMISPTDTPFLSMVQSSRDARSRVHQWTTDALAARTAGSAAVEGFTFSGGTLSGRTRLTNYTEIRYRPVSVSDSARAMDNVGTRDEFAYQMMKATKELATHIENAMWGTTTGNVGTSAAGATIKAILPWITTNQSTSAATRTLSSTLVNTELQACWTEGGEPDVMFCGGGVKRKLVNLVDTNYGERQVPANPQGGGIYQYVDIYKNDFGMQYVHLSRDIPTDTLAIIQMARWAVSWLTGRHPKMVPIGRRGDKTEAYCVGEFTLEARAENANARIEEITI